MARALSGACLVPIYERWLAARGRSLPAIATGLLLTYHYLFTIIYRVVFRVASPHCGDATPSLAYSMLIAASTSMVSGTIGSSSPKSGRITLLHLCLFPAVSRWTPPQEEALTAPQTPVSPPRTAAPNSPLIRPTKPAAPLLTSAQFRIYSVSSVLESSAVRCVRLKHLPKFL